MMQKHIIFIIFTLLFSFSATAQLEVEFSSTSTPTPGGTVDVDVSVSNFEDIISFQYYILWDSLVLSYDSVFNVTDQLEQFTIGNVGTPETIMNGVDGEMTVSWNHSSTLEFSLPDDTRLFTVRMNVVGSDCDSTAIAIGNLPPFQNIEVINADFEDIGAVATPIPFAIPGTDCGSGGGGGEDGIVLRSNSVSGDSGDNVCVSVIVDNFTDVQTAQGSMMWDPAVMSYTGTQNSILPGNTFGESSTDQGMLIFNWFDNSGVTPQNLPDGSTLFDVCFDLVGAPGTSSTFKFVDSPALIVFSDSNDEELPFTTTSSTISVNSDGGGGGGGGGGEGDLVIRMENASANPGSNICIPLTADNFTNIQTFQGGIMWDPAILSYTGTDNIAIPGVGFGDTSVGQGMLGFNWFDDSGVTPVTLPNGGTVFEVCFNVVGPAASTTDLKIIDLTNIFIEASDADGNILDVTTETGTFTATGGVDFTLNCSGASFSGGTNDCIDVTASGFSNISAIQFQMNWNDSQLSYTGVQNLNTAVSVLEGQFNQTANDLVRFSWFSSNGQGQTLADGSTLFSICFDAAPCSGATQSGSFNFVGDTQVPIEVGDGDGESVSVVTNNCSYSVSCLPPPECIIDFGTASISSPACFGASTGSITVNPTAGDCEINCTWFQAFPGGSVIDNGGGCSLMNQPPGDYILRVEAEGVVEERTYTIEDAEPLQIDGTIFPVTCNSLGGVNTTITGGSGTYNCEWQHNGAIGCNIGGLESGTYTLLVTDAIFGCQQVEPFSVGSDFNLAVTNNDVTDAGCDGGSITINLNQAGPFDYQWSHAGSTNAATQNGLEPGTYTCTITSPNGNCTLVVSETVEYSGTFAEVVSINTTNTSCNGNDGSASFDIVGGCLPYECEVIAPDGTSLPCDSDSLVNLEPGNYAIFVNDGSNNPTVSNNFVIGMVDPIMVEVTTTPQTSTSLGTISTTVTGGTPGYFYSWLPDPHPGLVQGAAQQSNLEAGFFGLTVTDMAGCTWVSEIDSIEVEDDTPIGPPELSNITQIDAICGGDGEFTANVSGQAPFVYSFDNGEGQIVEFSQLPAVGLDKGDYILTVTDMNGMFSTYDVNIGGSESIEISADNIVCDDGTNSGSISISTTGGNGGNIYTWSPIMNGTTNPEGLEAGTYEVEVMDSEGCTESSIFTVEDCVDPGEPEECGASSTVLTPNGDGVNDELFVMCAGDFPNNFAVYDRWGRLVHEAVNYQGGWNGTDLNGETVTEGVYYWVMDSTFDNGDHRIFKGFVNVIRETK